MYNLSTYFEYWVLNHKAGFVRDKTLAKYKTTGSWLKRLEIEIPISKLSKSNYQEIIRLYSQVHSHKTVMDFHRQIRASILDAYDDGIIQKDFTRKVFLGGRAVKAKNMFLEEIEAKNLMQSFELEKKSGLTWEHFLALLLTTGLRFSEALALTKNDFDFQNLVIHVTKSYNYQKKGFVNHRFQPTKNESSIRTIALDLKTAWILRPIVENINHTMPIFPSIEGEGHPVIYNSTINNRLKKYCQLAKIPIITLHGLRHTHASVLIANGISIQVVAKRLGHANSITTQNTYIHLLKSTEQKANEKITSILINW